MSDVTPPDFKQTFEYLLDASFFPELVGGEGVEQGGGASSEYLRLMVLRWKKYLDDGVFSLSVPVDTPIGASLDAADFWTAPYAYWNMETQAPGVFGLLKGSDLVVFKVYFYLCGVLGIGADALRLGRSQVSLSDALGDGPVHFFLALDSFRK